MTQPINLSNHVSGNVELSNFDGLPTYNAQQRWELFEQGLVTNNWCIREELRYAEHQLTPFRVNPNFSFEVEGAF